jgi:Zn-dependent protease
MVDKLKIINEEQLKKWLKDKPIKYSQIIACRSVLRALPLISGERIRNFSQDIQEGLILIAFRSCISSYISINNNGYKIELSTNNASKAAAAYANLIIGEPVTKYTIASAIYANSIHYNTAFVVYAAAATTNAFLAAINFFCGILIKQI